MRNSSLKRNLEKSGQVTEKIQKTNNQKELSEEVSEDDGPNLITENKEEE